MNTSIYRSRKFWLSVFITLIPAIVAIFFYSKFPDKIAVHFNFYFEPDNYYSKPYALFALPLVMVGFNIIIWGLLYKKTLKNTPSAKILDIVLWIIPVVSCVTFFVMQYYALNEDISVIRIIPACVGILFIVVGNFLPQSEPNYLIGIRLPWTLKNREVWKKTNRLGGRLMVIGGFIIALYSFLPTPPSWLLFLTIIFIVIYPTIYSYIIYKKEINKNK